MSGRAAGVWGSDAQAFFGDLQLKTGSVYEEEVTFCVPFLNPLFKNNPWFSGVQFFGEMSYARKPLGTEHLLLMIMLWACD